ncbi:hypothetical protein OEZ85_013349 [Tetradesmus obliquus]|uniref:Rhodanese domain-containing protein n=1 Tax=Tetradesmus obliquus TaxID=3088 RepID=A0ABY8U5G6_TETOB|nr:hypothetical protein OEZ85_013349 [Tetradesmus obliquus]
MKVLVVGGVAGGASAAARLRRLTEAAEITIFERGPYVSFANCGLPYFIGDIIEEESKLLVATPAKFKKWFNVDVQDNTEVISIDRKAKTITARNVLTGEQRSHAYDALVLSPGAAPLKPPLPGVDLPGIFSVKTVPDSRAIKAWIAEHSVKQAVVVGGGFIGIEMVENLVHRGIKTTLVEMLPQVMPPFDPEMVEPVHERLAAKGVELCLGDGLKAFEQQAGGNGLVVHTASGKALPADLALLVVGVRPETSLAKEAGLTLGQRGIAVDAHMRTSDPSIYAVGDAVEIKDWVTGQQTLIPLAGPANRQGRIAADNIAGRSSTFRGSQGSSVVGIFGLTLAGTGASEKTLKRLSIPYRKVYIHAGHHAGYYPGAKTIDLKLLFSPEDGKVLGCQAVGEEGVEKRVDVVAAFMQKGGTVFDLEEAELCYAPQYGSAKDPVNLAGMVASNVMRGDHPVEHWDAVDWPAVAADPSALIVDVREPGEVARGAVEGAVNFPLSSLREKLHELPQDKKLYVYCQVGLRGYNATRQLLLAGKDAVNVSGGFRSWQQAKL